MTLECFDETLDQMEVKKWNQIQLRKMLVLFFIFTDGVISEKGVNIDDKADEALNNIITNKIPG